MLKNALGPFQRIGREKQISRLGRIKKASPETISRRGHRGDSRRISAIFVWSGPGTVEFSVRALV